MTAQLMAGKRGLIMGVANDHSIAWGIARACAAAGAELAFTWQGPTQERRVRALAAGIGAENLLPCDVSREGDIPAVLDTLGDRWGRLDFAVHAIAHTDRVALQGRYVDTDRANFAHTLDVSCFSFTSLAKAAAPLMTDGGSLLTLTYDGASRVMPHYNVMGVAKAALEASVRYLADDLGSDGVRVNALSAGPMRTLAGSAVAGARFVYKWQGANAPLRRNMTLEDVGGAGLYLLSDLSAGVTGAVHHVDGGYHTVGMAAVDV